VATATDLAAFERLLKPYSVEKVAIIGAGGTARAALGALSGRCDHVDVILRNPNRIEPLERLIPQLPSLHFLSQPHLKVTR
jgi:shikimate 5-dehydrogenase